MSLPGETGLQNSPLSRLPAELRNQIFEYALQNPYPIRVEAYEKFPTREDGLRKDKNCITNKNCLALAATCRQLHRETVGIFYSINTFHPMKQVWPKDRPAHEVLALFRKHIGEKNFRAIKQIQLTVNLNGLGWGKDCGIKELKSGMRAAQSIWASGRKVLLDCSVPIGRLVIDSKGDYRWKHVVLYLEEYWRTAQMPAEHRFILLDCCARTKSMMNPHGVDDECEESADLCDIRGWTVTRIAW